MITRFSNVFAKIIIDGSCIFKRLKTEIKNQVVNMISLPDAQNILSLSAKHKILEKSVPYKYGLFIRLCYVYMTANLNDRILVSIYLFKNLIKIVKNVEFITYFYHCHTYNIVLDGLTVIVNYIKLLFIKVDRNYRISDIFSRLQKRRGFTS